MGKSVIIAGGGAAGLTAAVFAARQGAKVTLLESMERPGRKLLLTGNGRCNLTNLDPSLPEKYYGSGAALAKEITGRFGASEAISFFEGLGLLTMEKNGYVYPYSAQSGAVLDVLLQELRRLSVKLKFGEKVQSVTKDQDMWRVKTATWCYTADALVLACGGRAMPSTGSDGSGYELAGSLGHTIQMPRPALTAVECRGKIFESLAGIRCRAEVSLYKYKEDLLLKKEIGELQWTKYGVSGIVIFQLSRFISECSDPEQLYLAIDLLPEFDAAYLKELLVRRSVLLSGERAATLLSGMLHEKLIPVVLKNARVPEKIICKDLKEEQLGEIIRQIKYLRLVPTGTKSFDACQVCSGGVDGREVLGGTLESRKQSNLYFAGELLDVDGPCGGYNLQWAWASGYAAGTAAGKA